MTSERMADVTRRHGIRLLVEFGSSVTGHLHARSDHDLAVLLDRVPDSLVAYTDLLADLQDLFPEREVDLAILNRADPLFLKKITERCRLLHGSHRDFHQLRMYAFRRYQDHRRFLALERDYVARRLRALAG
jgi:uncharacterized protein